MVVAIQQPNTPKGVPLDLSAAEVWGRVEVLCPNGKHVLAPESFIRATRKRLDELDFDEMTDYIIPVGDLSALFFVGMLVGDRWGEVQLLRWVAEARAYQPLKLSLHEGIYQ